MRYILLLTLAVFSATAFAAEVPDARPVLIVAGMLSEKNVAVVDPNVIVVLSGGNSALLKERLAAFDPQSVKAVVSFGMAGALYAKLKVGDMLVSSEIVTDDGHVYPTDANLSSSIYLKIKKRNLRTYGGSLVGSAVEHLSAASKADLFAQTKAVGVDMESQEAAAFAAEHGLPFAVLRTISDPANFDLPAAIREAINPDGSINYQAVISAIFRDPSQIGPLLQSAFYSMTAFRHLRRARDAVHLGTL